MVRGLRLVWGCGERGQDRYSSLGPKEFTVTAWGYWFNTTTVTHNYTVVAPPDTTPPGVTIIQPDLATYELGATVFAMYTCADPGGSGIASCAGTVPDGDPIDTSTLGAKTFTVTGTDNATNETIVTHGYTVVDTIDPVVTIIQPDLATYELGATVFAMYTCADPGGSRCILCGDGPRR